MAIDDWYRNSTWSDHVQKEFFERLDRSRGARAKAQYVRIQAYHLEQAGTRESYSAAIELLELIRERWWDDAGQAQVFHQLARCREGLGEVSEAVGFYRQAVQAQREFPGIQTDAHLDFGWLVMKENLESHFEEVSNLIDEFGMSAFPATRYRGNAIKALVLESQNLKAEAKACATAALDAAAETQSGFAHHQRLGLVESVGDGVYCQLKQIRES